MIILDMYSLEFRLAETAKTLFMWLQSLERKGMEVIGLTEENDGELVKLSDVCIKVPQIEIRMLQELHPPMNFW